MGNWCHFEWFRSRHWVILRPNLTPCRCASIGLVLLHELTFHTLRIELVMAFGPVRSGGPYRLLDWFNPGYLRRYEQKQKRERGIDYWLRPSAVA
jgi:hypothetical protein